MKESLNLPHNADLEEIVVCAAIRFIGELVKLVYTVVLGTTA